MTHSSDDLDRMINEALDAEEVGTLRRLQPPAAPAVQRRLQRPPDAPEAARDQHQLLAHAECEAAVGRHELKGAVQGEREHGRAHQQADDQVDDHEHHLPY